MEEEISERIVKGRNVVETLAKVMKGRSFSLKVEARGLLSK